VPKISLTKLQESDIMKQTHLINTQTARVWTQHNKEVEEYRYTLTKEYGFW
jgi:hypothetical protein